MKGVLRDGGYVGQPFAQGGRGTLGEYVTVQIAKRRELHTSNVMPTRWVVERSFAWLEKNGGCEKTATDGSVPACGSHTRHSWLYCSKDF